MRCNADRGRGLEGFGERGIRAKRDGSGATPEDLALATRAKRSVAEREGFEPPVPFQVLRFSRPPPSTTRPSLHAGESLQVNDLQEFPILCQVPGRRIELAATASS